MNDMEGSVQLMAEGLQDRIVGYPEPGWEEDFFVPFFDMETKPNKYPRRLPPPPIDWSFNILDSFGMRKRCLMCPLVVNG